MSSRVRTLSVTAALLSAIFASSIFTPAAAQRTVDVSANAKGRGGNIGRHDTRFANNAAQGDRIRISGVCRSACTLVFGRVSRDKICVTPSARIGFHRGTNPRATDAMWNAYDSGIQGWINARTGGGLPLNFIWMTAPDTYRFFKRC